MPNATEYLGRAAHVLVAAPSAAGAASPAEARLADAVHLSCWRASSTHGWLGTQLVRVSSARRGLSMRVVQALAAGLYAHTSMLVADCSWEELREVLRGRQAPSIPTTELAVLVVSDARRGGSGGSGGGLDEEQASTLREMLLLPACRVVLLGPRAVGAEWSDWDGASSLVVEREAYARGMGGAAVGLHDGEVAVAYTDGQGHAHALRSDADGVRLLARKLERSVADEAAIDGASDPGELVPSPPTSPRRAAGAQQCGPSLPPPQQRCPRRAVPPPPPTRGATVIV